MFGALLRSPLRAHRFAPIHLAPLDSVYDIEDAKNDKATVPIYYESRLAKLDINREEIDALNQNVEDVKRMKQVVWDGGAEHSSP